MFKKNAMYPTSNFEYVSNTNEVVKKSDPNNVFGVKAKRSKSSEYPWDVPSVSKRADMT